MDCVVHSKIVSCFETVSPIVAHRKQYNPWQSRGGIRYCVFWLMHEFDYFTKTCTSKLGAVVTTLVLNIATEQKSCLV